MTSTRDHGPIEDRVRAILQKSIVCDLTLPWGPDNENKEATIPRWRASGFDFVSLTVALDWTSLAATVGSIAAERARFQARADRYVLVETVADIERAKREGKCAIGFHFQGTNPLDGNLAMVETYYRLGVRHMLLAYNQTNAVGAGCHEPVDEGLTGFGRELIAEMNRVGMIVDCTHTPVLALRCRRWRSRPRRQSSPTVCRGRCATTSATSATSRYACVRARVE